MSSAIKGTRNYYLFFVFFHSNKRMRRRLKKNNIQEEKCLHIIKTKSLSIVLYLCIVWIGSGRIVFFADYYNSVRLFSVETYLSPVETHCMNVDYFFLDPENQTHEFSEDAMTRLRTFAQNIIYQR